VATYPPIAPAPNLAVSHLFSRGWNAFKANLGLVYAILVAYVVISSIFSYKQNGGAFSGMLALVGLVIGGPLTAGMYRATLRLARGEAVEFVSMFDGFKRFGIALGVYWLVAIATVVGLCLLIVPGIVIGLGLAPALFLVLEENAGVMDTLRRAWAVTQGHKMDLFVLSLALAGFNILGLLALVVGVLVTAPASVMIFAAAIDEMIGREAVPVAEAIPIVPATPMG
jgi:uncharacterized membrane protein